MDELQRQMEDAREALAPQWSPERGARLYAATLQRKRRQTVRRAAAASIGAIGAVSLLALAMQQPAARPAPADGAGAVAQRTERSGHTLRVADGSFAQLVGARSDLEVTHNTKQRVAFKLLAGRAHFEVVPNPLRSFVVEAHPYRVEVIGTVFDVDRSERSVTVSVQRGRVRVYGPSGAQDVVAGQIQSFARPVIQSTHPPPPVPGEQPEAPEAVLDDAPAAEDGEEPVRPRTRGKRAGGALPKWRSLSQSGEYEAAFESLRRGESVDDDPAALMDAADAARLSGHPRNAVDYLERVVRDHARSPVAPLAAFTLGRVYLDKLGQPDRAAQAFERARRLAPEGSLAQDALAREVEALSKGGNAHKAYQRGQEYLERYPNGRRVRAVQLYAGME
jgi:transmembrane sensor